MATDSASDGGPGKEPIKTVEKEQEDKQLTCGLVMPISKIDNLDESHWLDVRGILKNSIESGELGFDVIPVFESDEAGIIHKTIVQNLFDNDIVVCDVSCNNPNVMFELGMRLAFNKPTVIVVDDETKINFDTGVIQHIKYPRDLRHTKILEFKELLKSKVENTYLRSMDDDYRSFLDNFTHVVPSKIDSEQVTNIEYLQKQIKDISESISRLNNKVTHASRSNSSTVDRWKNGSRLSTKSTFIKTIRNWVLNHLPENYKLLNLSELLEEFLKHENINITELSTDDVNFAKKQIINLIDIVEIIK